MLTLNIKGQAPVKGPAHPCSSGRSNSRTPSAATSGYFLALKAHTASGSVRLVIVDAKGKQVKDGNVLKFKPDGTFYRYHTINKGCGVPRDNEGRIPLPD